MDTEVPLESPTKLQPLKEGLFIRILKNAKKAIFSLAWKLLKKPEGEKFQSFSIHFYWVCFPCCQIWLQPCSFLKNTGAKLDHKGILFALWLFLASSIERYKTPANYPFSNWIRSLEFPLLYPVCIRILGRKSWKRTHFRCSVWGPSRRNHLTVRFAGSHVKV